MGSGFTVLFFGLQTWILFSIFYTYTLLIVQEVFFPAVSLAQDPFDLSPQY